MDYENTLMTALATQLRNLQSKDPRSDENVTRMYRSIFTVIDCVRIKLRNSVFIRC